MNSSGSEPGNTVKPHALSPEKAFLRQALDRLRTKLLDLTRRNKLLNFRDGSRTIRVVDELPNSVFDLLVNQGRKLEFRPASEELLKRFTEQVVPPPGLVSEDGTLPTALAVGINYDLPDAGESSSGNNRRFVDSFLQTAHDEKKLESKLTKVNSEHQRIVEETGVSTLYLALGFLEWFESDESAIPNLAPLILVPVTLDRLRVGNGRGAQIKYHLRYDDQDLQSNISLAELLRTDFGLILPELNIEESDLEPEEYLKSITELVRVKKRWRVRREIAVDFFSFAKLFIYLDLDTNRWSETNGITAHKLVRQLLGVDQVGDSRPLEEDLDIDADPIVSRIPLVLDADSSQHKVIAAALRDQSIVVEGPPGTGKSQTITNLVVALLERGKTVLFVAEKLAALQVVKRRLDSVGLGHYVLELHSHKTNKQQLLDNIRERIDHWPIRPKGLEESQREIERCREHLNRYVRLVNSVFAGSGLRIFDILWRYDELLSKNSSLQLVSIRNAENVNITVSNDNVARFRQLTKLLDARPGVAELWCGIDLSNVNPVNLSDFRQVLLDLRLSAETVNSCVEKIKFLTNSSEFPDLATIRSIEAIPLGVPGEAFRISPNQEILTACSNGEEASSLRVFLKDCEKLKLMEEEVSGKLPGVSALSEDEFNEFIKAFAAIMDIGFREWPVDKIERLIDRATDLDSAITEILTEAFPSVLSLGYKEPRTIVELEAIIKYLELAARQVEPLWIDSINSITIQSDCLSTYERARQECLALPKCSQKVLELLGTENQPKISEIEDVLAVLRDSEGRWFNWLRRDVREAKRISRAWVDGRINTLPLLTSELDSLKQLVNSHNKIISSPEFTSRFGSMFLGLKSDWESIGRFASWCSAVMAQSPGNQVYKKIVSDFREFQASALDALSVLTGSLRRYTEAAKQLTSTIEQEKMTLDFFVDLTPTLSLSNIHQKLKKVVDHLALNSQRVSPYLSSPRIPLSKYADYIVKEEQRRELLLTVQGREPGAKDNLGLVYSGIDEEFSEILKSVNWALDVHKVFPANYAVWVLERDSVKRLEGLVGIFSELKGGLKELHSLELRVRYFGQKDGGEEPSSPSMFQSLANIFEFVDRGLESLDSALHWGDICRLFNEIKKRELGAIVELLAQGRLSSSQLADCYQLSLYRSQVLAIFLLHPELGSFSREEHEAVRDKFRRMDRDTQSMLAMEVACGLMHRRVPDGRSVGKVKEFTDMGLIRHELQKKKRHIPVRQLLRRSGNALQNLKPCFMMSPLSVAQFIPPDGLKFDFVVMDEASQLKVEDCLGAIARSSQLIVVGDSNQLPPTQFFERICDDGDNQDETSVDDMESILDACAKIYHPTHRLLWHYRSQHEDLIRFSNFHFYNNSLLLFPSPNPLNRELGVHHRYIEDGYFSAGRNQKEAEVVSRAVLDHLQSYPNDSLGVGTFNQEQRDLIRDQIETQLRDKPDLWPLYEQAQTGPEPFFVKNLENIQGDERDVIFISCTYGKDRESGKVYQRYGPINSPVGWRRLNVIFTRAKKRLVVFTSLRSDDVIADERSPKGTRMLKQYLKYAESKEMVDLGELSERGADSDFEVSVGDVIRQLGYEFVPNLGVAGFFIDIAVRHPSRRDIFMLGIECDGAAYHSGKCARDRDRLREDILEKRGWKLHRIWSTDWFKNRRIEVDRLANTLKQAAAAISV